ncbi:TPA: hypothetical protein TZS71_001493 [Streptococcus suis]|nr:hypothetical protein [Streptococcus suis]
MKKTTQIISALSLIVAIILGTFVVLKSCHSSETQSVSYQKKTSTTQSSSVKKEETKPSTTTTKETSSSSVSTSMSEEVSSPVAGTDSQTEIQVQPSESAPPQQSEDTIPSQQGSEIIEQSIGGLGVCENPTGTLDVDKKVPVYAEPNKATDIVYIQDGGYIEFDGYFNANGEWWYTFQIEEEGQVTRYYLAYSDIGH